MAWVDLGWRLTFGSPVNAARLQRELDEMQAKLDALREQVKRQRSQGNGDAATEELK